MAREYKGLFFVGGKSCLGLCETVTVFTAKATRPRQITIAYSPSIQKWNTYMTGFAPALTVGFFL